MPAYSLAENLTHIEEGRAADVVDALTEHVKQEPDDLPARYALGHALETLERWSEASQVWRVVVRPPIPDILSETDAPLHHSEIDLEEFPFEDTGTLEGDLEIVTPTYANVMASQGQYNEAAKIYEQLAEVRPEEKAHFLEKAAHMRDLDQSAP